MSDNNKNLEHNFTRPAIYKIVGLGKIDNKLAGGVMAL